VTDMTQERKEIETALGEPRKGILKTIRESGKSTYELSWVTGADIFFILKALKQLKRDLISVRTRFAVHWCYPLREVS